MTFIAMEAPGLKFEYGQFEWPRNDDRRVVHPQHVLSMTEVTPSRRAEGWYELGASRSPATPLGRILIVPAEVPFHTRGDGGAWKVARLELLPTGCEFDRLFQNHDPRVFQNCLNIKSTDVANTMQRLAREALAPGFASNLILEALAITLRIDILRYLKQSAESAHTPQQLSRVHLKEVTDYVHAHSDKRISVKDLAHLIGLSERHFMRLFRATTGTTVHQFVEHQRFEAAKRLLDESDLPLKQIAHHLGFSSRVGFTLAFQRFSGLSPRDYRRQSRRQSPVVPCISWVGGASTSIKEQSVSPACIRPLEGKNV